MKKHLDLEPRTFPIHFKVHFLNQHPSVLGIEYAFERVQ